MTNATKKETKKEAKKKAEELVIDIPLTNGANVQITNGTLTFSANGKTFTKTFNQKILNVTTQEGKVTIKVIGKPTRAKTAQAYSIKAHLRNMNQGATTEYSKEMQIIFAHFPVTIEVKGKDVYIKNFLGEKQPRMAKIHGDAKVEAKGQTITIKGNNKEDVGQTANNLKRATRITNKDNRIFQDGIYYS